MRHSLSKFQETILLRISTRSTVHTQMYEDCGNLEDSRIERVLARVRGKLLHKCSIRRRRQILLGALEFYPTHVVSKQGLVDQEEETSTFE